MITALRGLLALALLAGFYVVSGLVVLVFLAYVTLVIGFAGASGNWLADVNPAMIAGMAVAVAAVVEGLVEAGRSPGGRPGTVRLFRDTEPALWATVEELAERVGAPAPTQIRLTAEANAAVSEDGPLLGRSDERRLYVGLPLLLGLSRDEFRAVLCHELGHYAGRHTRFGAITYRGSAALAGIRDRMSRAGSANPVVRWYGGFQSVPIAAYAWFYDWVSLAVRRRQELEADAAAAAVAGAAVLADALRSIGGLAVAWEDFRRSGERFGSFEPAPDRTEPVDRPRTRLDSHPPIQIRLRRLAAYEERPADRDPTPARHLLQDPDRLADRMWRANRLVAGGTVKIPGGREDARWSRNIAIPVMLVVLLASWFVAVNRDDPTPSGRPVGSYSYRTFPVPTLSLPTRPLMSFAIVERGDTLARIACRHRMTVRELVRLNRLTDTKLRTGQVLYTPRPADPSARCSR